MMLRPASTRWFEVLCARTDSVRTVARLAHTGAVEIEVRPGRPQDLPLADLAAGLATYAELLPRYARYWSRGPVRPSSLAAAPAAVLRMALDTLEAWRAEADPLIDAIQSDENLRDQLLHLRRILEDMRASLIDFDRLLGAGPILASFCGFMPLEADPRLPEDCLFRTVPWDDERCILVVGPADRIEAARDRVRAVKGRLIERPPWLQGTAAEALERVEVHLSELSRSLAERYGQLDRLFDRHGLGEVLGEVEKLYWFQRNLGGLERASEHFVWITGWTDDLRGERLAAALEDAGSGALLRFPTPPLGLRPPQTLDNPPWLQPFEIFARALGIPAADEADPTPLLAVVVPFLFGYMFGDLGQGLVLLAAGFWLRRRFALARLLIPCGISASLFGLLYGHLFGLDHLIPALWLHPLDDPLRLLAVPLVFAVGLLTLGQLLHGLGALWGSRLRDWLATDAGFLVLYLGAVGTLLDPAFLWLLVAGAVWNLAGSYWLHRRLVGALVALAHLAEGGLQILVNTLSFARVGAFALAHAALSSACLALADAVASPIGKALVLVLGNLVVILLEGLVVSIQTTRLVMFEFFVRFLQGRGRVFRPLEVPPEVAGLQPGAVRGGA